MQKKKLVVLLVVVAISLSLISLGFIKITAENKPLSDVPFDYMTNLKGRSVESYENLTIPEQKLVYSIPEDIPATLTTKALLETILENYFLLDLFAYDDFVRAVQSREEQFRIVEFLEREDSLTVIDEYIELYTEKVKTDTSSKTSRQLRFLKSNIQMG